MDFLKLAKERYSCRKFSSKPVEDDKLNRILEAAISAPTAKNLQPFRIFVFSSEEAQAKIRSATPCHFNAPVILIIAGKKEEAFTRASDGRNFEDIDASIAATHLMLQVQAEGLGTTWVGLVDTPKARELFPELDGYDIVALFPIGYPADDAAPSERHALRKSKADLVRYV